MQLLQAIEAYTPQNEQEQQDQQQMLQYLSAHPECVYRSDSMAHFTASVWVVDESCNKTLMVYHNLYDSWSWIGGHADGEQDLCAVAMRELQEETGLQNAVLLSNEIFSLETLTVSGHVKKGVWLPSHLHFNLTYLAQAGENEPLRSKPDENKAVRWMPFEEALSSSTEPWMVQNVYRKLVDRCRKTQ